MTRCAIRCDSEPGVILSSDLESEAWDAIETLVNSLNSRGQIVGNLFLWKSNKSHIAKAKETYAWRAVIDLIKENDLGKLGQEIELEALKNSNSHPSQLLRSKPIMLRVAGEITNALIHSYNNRHAITFFSV
jgi:hypothetical protein